jgi:hypothetical protein
MRFFAIAACIVGVLCIQPVQAFTLTVESPSSYAASSAVGATQQVNFEGLTTGSNNGYNVSFVDATSGNTFKATYDALQVYNYGNTTQTAGAGYTGKFVSNFTTGAPDGVNLATTNLTFTDQTQGGASAGVKYFGLFISSLDSNNQLTVYNGATVVAQFSISNIPTLLNNNSAYIGGPYSQYGAFFNFYADGSEQFTRIQFTQLGGGGFETDNHTFRVPAALQRTGTGVNLSGLGVTGGSVQTVPEPSPLMSSLFLSTVYVSLSLWSARRKSISTQPINLDVNAPH